MEGRRCAPHSALVLIAAQRAWSGAEWQRLQGLSRGGSVKAPRVRGGGNERGGAGGAAATEDARPVLESLHAAGAVVQSKVFLESGLPGVHVALRLPAAIDSSLVPGVERLPQLYLDADPASELAHGCPLARCVGLQQWIESVLVEAGVRTLVLGGATQSGLVHRMARALQQRYGAREATKRLRRVGGKGRALPRLRIVVDRRLCGDFAAMREPACADCLAQWRRRGYSPPTGPSCAHPAESAERPHTAVGASEAELRALGVRICDGFDWSRLGGWTDAELAAAAARKARRVAMAAKHEAKLDKSSRSVTGSNYCLATCDPSGAEVGDGTSEDSEGGVWRSRRDGILDDAREDDLDYNSNDEDDDAEDAFAGDDGAATWLEASAGLHNVSGWPWVSNDGGSDGDAARLVLERIERREMREAECEGRRIAAAADHVRNHMRASALRSARANMLVEDIESAAAREADRLERHFLAAAIQVDQRREGLLRYIECERVVEEILSRVAPAPTPVGTSLSAGDAGALALAAERDIDELLARLVVHDRRARGVAETTPAGAAGAPRAQSAVVVPAFIRARRED